MITVPVALSGRSYEIKIAPGLLAQAGALIKPLLPSARVLPITDAHVGAHHLPVLLTSLQAANLSVIDPIIVEPGEQTKSLSAFEALIEAMLARTMERGVTVLALGGGVVGDLAGFAAATILRGVPVIQIPTTLLAQVDSAVGGKTGINTRHGKNLLGALHQPRLVISDPLTLATLPAREWRCGYAEILKYGLINNAPFYQWCLRHGAQVLAGESEPLCEAIKVSCASKAAIVAEDEGESGARMLLNLGHTFAHALEAQCGYDGRLAHGEAVAVGLVLAAQLSARLQLCPANLAQEIAAHLRALGLPAAISDTPARGTPAATLLAHMLNDKKVKDGKLTFILLRGAGESLIVPGIDAQNVLPVLES